MYRAYMVDTVTITFEKGQYTWGEKAVFEKTFRARVERKQRMVRNFKGEMVASVATVYLEDMALSLSDKIKFDGVSHHILSIEKMQGFRNPSVLEVKIG